MLKNLTPGRTALFCICLFINVLAFAQSLANYASTRATGVTYSTITFTGTAFDSWRNTANFSQDDNRSDFTDIGFDFWYDGTRYTQFCASTNGFIDFSASTDNGDGTADDFGYDNSAFTTNNTANSTNPAIAAFYDDLTAQGGTDALGNGIKYYLVGTAPTRTLTIEWINMAIYTNTTPSLNFQIRLCESTGVIVVNYGTMQQGTVNFSYTMGLNGPVLNATPTTAQLKVLQTANTNTFGNGEQNNLNAMPAANSRYTFTPPVPAAPTGTLNFTAITQAGMTLNWTNWATNEIGYVIYNSTDGINYKFVRQTAANATNAAITGLLPSTLYYWRVYAVTEGCLSTPLSRSQATSGSGNKISITNGNWNAANTWSPTGVPTSADNVTISNGNTVSITADGTCNNLTIGTGGAASVLRFNNNTAYNLTVNGNIMVNTNGTFNVNTTSNTTHNLIAYGDISNNGTLNFATDNNSFCNTSFVKDGNQTLSGTGATFKFNTITLNMGESISNILELTSSTFTAATNFLTLQNGTFKVSVNTALNLTLYTAAATIPRKSAIWMNSPTATINTGAGLTIYGGIAVSSGTFNVGNAADEDILSSGGTINVAGGALRIAGKYYSQGINNLSYFAMSGGTVTIPSSGSTNTTIAPFQMSGAGSRFAMSGGILFIPREGGTGAQDLGFVNTGSTTGAVTGGTLQIGGTGSPATQVISVNSTYSVGTIWVNNANVTARLLTNGVKVIKDVAISTGTLNANNLDIQLGGNWINNGGTFVPGTGMTTFNSGTPQTIFKSGGETFNAVTMVGAGIKTFLSPVNCNASFVINTGTSVDVGTNNYQLAIKANFMNSGNFVAHKGTVLLNGTTVQSIGGAATTNFYDLTINNTAGVGLGHAENMVNTLTLNNGNFSTNGNAFTLLSTLTGSARIAQITGTGNITGNVTVQRFAKGGSTGWALIGTPITSALTLNDWDDDIAISCNTCPDGSAMGFLSIYTYNEAVGGAFDNPAAYIPINTINDPIIPGKGYWVYLGTGQVTTTNITMDVTGAVRKFNYALPITRTNTGSVWDDGWNLVCNPYPSPIKWSLLRGSTANIDNAIYTYNADLNGGLGAYATYINGVSSPALNAGGISDTIPICQGFYVHSTGATALNAQESNKVGGNPMFLKTSATTQVASSIPLLRLHLKGSGTYLDETVLYMQAGATDDFEEDYDAYKMAVDVSAPSLALEKNNTLFQVNGVAPINGNFSMPLRATTGTAGTHTISIADMGTFPQGACINLYDSVTGITTDLRNNAYTFNLPTSTTSSRFLLTITLDPLQINSNQTDPTCDLPNSGKIVASGANSGPWDFYWKDVNGSAIRTRLNRSTADTLAALSNGDYQVEIHTVAMCDNSTEEFTVTGVDFPTADFVCADTIDITSGGLVQFTNNSQNAVSYNWNFGDGSGTSVNTNPDYYYSATGSYTITLIATSPGGCTDTSYQVVVVTEPLSTGINEQSLENTLILKTLDNNEFVLQQRSTEAGEVSIQLSDELGRLLVDYGRHNSTTLNLPLDLRPYKPGIYFLQIRGEKEKKVIKLPVR